MSVTKVNITVDVFQRVRPILKVLTRLKVIHSGFRMISISQHIVNIDTLEVADVTQQVPVVELEFYK